MHHRTPFMNFLVCTAVGLAAGTATYTSQAGTLSNGSQSPRFNGETVDLNAVGSEDWAVFGFFPPEGAFSPFPAVANLTASASKPGGSVINETLSQSSVQDGLVDLSPFTDTTIGFDSDSNGTPDLFGGVNMRNFVGFGLNIVYGDGDTFTLSLAADETLRTLTLYMLISTGAIEGVTATLDAALADASAPDLSFDVTSTAVNPFDEIFAIEVQYAADAPTTLDIIVSGVDTYPNNGGTGIGLVAAAVQVVPEPGTAALVGLSPLVLLCRRARLSVTTFAP